MDLADTNMNYSELELKALARHVDETSVTNGFDRPTWETIPSKLMFVVSELDEALQTIKHTNDEPIEVELADTAIRLLSILVAVWDHNWQDRISDLRISPAANVYEPAEVALWRILRPLVHALERWRYDDRDGTRMSLEVALRETWVLATRLGHNLFAEIVKKAEINAGRGKWHGKAKGAG